MSQVQKIANAAAMGLMTIASGKYRPGSGLSRFRSSGPAYPDSREVSFEELGQPVELTITPKAAGEYAFTCQMQMYRGTLVVKDR